MIKYSDEKIVIRDAEKNDIPVLFKLINELAEYEKLSSTVIANEEGLAKVMFGENNFVQALIAEYEKNPVGFALFFHNYSTFVGKAGFYLEDLYVKPEMRGKGIGKKLLSILIKTAKERNCGRIEWAVLDWNKTAIDFYEKLGAVQLNEWITYRLTEDKFNDALSSD
ncbi:MAG: GNAT family N-acetyltransferase [Ignavibacteriaceae bacterium]|nr:GNAT family N-acetyltransferase [Ignavibacteriaceae bacterium]